MNSTEERQPSPEEIQRLRALAIQSALDAIYEIEQLKETIVDAIHKNDVAAVDGVPVKSSDDNRFIGIPFATLSYIRGGLTMLRDAELMKIGRGIVENARHFQDSQMTLTLEIPIEGTTEAGE